MQENDEESRKSGPHTASPLNKTRSKRSSSFNSERFSESSTDDENANDDYPKAYSSNDELSTEAYNNNRNIATSMEKNALMSLLEFSDAYIDNSSPRAITNEEDRTFKQPKPKMFVTTKARPYSSSSTKRKDVTVKPTQAVKKLKTKEDVCVNTSIDIPHPQTTVVELVREVTLSQNLLTQ
jgi:hypothetical protein